MPFRANYYTVCATIGTINKFFEKTISEFFTEHKILFTFLRLHQDKFLYKIIQTIERRPSTEKKDPQYSIFNTEFKDFNLQNPSVTENKCSETTTVKFHSARRKRIPNKHSKQRSQFLIKSAFKLQEIIKRILSISNQGKLAIN